MQKLLYFLRVFFVSFEFLIIAIGFLIHVKYIDQIGSFLDLMKLSSEGVKWLALAPVTLLAWIYSEVKFMLIGDRESIRVLSGWDDYWMLKIHTSVNLFYSTAFLFCCLVPVWTELWLNDARYFLVCAVGFLGLIVSARDIYSASIRVKELTGKLKFP